MLAQARVGRLDFLDGGADAPRDRRSGTFGRVAHLPRSASEPGVASKLVDNAVEFGASRSRSCRIIIGFGAFEFLL